MTKPVLRGDNGATLKATTVLAMPHWLGIAPSYSRLRVSDGNAFVEALFRTAKYRPRFPARRLRRSRRGALSGDPLAPPAPLERRHARLGADRPRHVEPRARHALRNARRFGSMDGK